MSLKLNTASGGSITLQEADTASNLTLTVPAQAGSIVTADSSGNLLFNSGYGSAATAYGCRAWVNFNGTGTVAIRASGNVSSITDNGTGDYTVNFSTAMPDANYSTNISWNQPTFGSTLIGAGVHSDTSDNLTLYSTTQVRLRSMFINSVPTGAVRDMGLLSVAIFR
jgi:uncharacterized protein (AIM24 family)